MRIVSETENEDHFRSYDSPHNSKSIHKPDPDFAQNRHVKKTDTTHRDAESAEKRVDGETPPIMGYDVKRA